MHRKNVCTKSLWCDENVYVVFACVITVHRRHWWWLSPGTNLRWKQWNPKWHEIHKLFMIHDFFTSLWIMYGSVIRMVWTPHFRDHTNILRLCMLLNWGVSESSSFIRSKCLPLFCCLRLDFMDIGSSVGDRSRLGHCSHSLSNLFASKLPRASRITPFGLNTQLILVKNRKSDTKPKCGCCRISSWVRLMIEKKLQTVVVLRAD